MASNLKVTKLQTNKIKSSNGIDAITSDASGNLNIPNLSASFNFDTLERWTTATRPPNVEGAFGFNEDFGYVEFYNNGSWRRINEFNSFVTTGLVFHIDPTNPSSYSGSGSTVFDLSGNNYDITLNNNPGYEGYSFRFTAASSQNATVPTAAIPTGNTVSYEVWARGETNISSSSIEARNSGGSRTINVHLTWSNGIVYWDCGGDRLDNAAINSSEYFGWHHWVFTKDASSGSQKIYLDGVEWASRTGATGSITATASARIASYANNTTYHQGELGITRIYNIELSAAQVLKNYNSSKSIYVGGL